VKVLLVGNYAPDHQHSMLRFAALLETELRRAGHSVRLIHPKAHLGRLARAGRDLGKWLGYADKFILFPARLRAAVAAADVVHICDHAYSLLTRYLTAVPHVVTCHDLIAVRSAQGEFPGVHTGWSGRRYQQMIVNGLARARQVTCVSQSTKSDVLRQCAVPSSRTSVVHHGLNFAYRPASEAEKSARLNSLGIDGERFVLHVGSPNWYKNQPGMIRIFKELGARPRGSDLALVIVSNGVTPALIKLIGECGLQGRVRILSDVEPEDLRALYSSAEALLFPSLYEGFGWPIIEAQACGCPVFTSNRPPMTEVGGDGASYIDPENPEEAATIMLENIPLASRMREAGFANVRRFSVEKMVTGYVRAYAEATKSVSTLDSGEPTESIRATDFERDSRESHSLRERL
jgi:glycosyltransferase involved in cell wall biosynthesis